MTERPSTGGRPPGTLGIVWSTRLVPRLLIFDVNETLSDMSPMGTRFEDVGAPAHLATSWFAGLLRDGFALAAVDSSDSCAHVAAESLRVSLHG